jgi:hypothetical protein
MDMQLFGYSDVANVDNSGLGHGRRRLRSDLGKPQKPF